jgi:hypothetical protein
MSSFDIDVTRDGGCWTVHIREVNGPAQGRTISEAEWVSLPGWLRGGWGVRT